MDDDGLIRRFVKTRDERAFRELYARHTPAVYGLLRRLARPNTSDADDALQDAWLRAAVRLATFRGDSTFRTWFTGIALNCLRERRRDSARISELPDERITAARSRAVEVADALDSLTPAHREILVLHDVEGFTHDEIAGALGIEVGTSKSRLSRARQLFRERWRAAPAPRGAET